MAHTAAVDSRCALCVLLEHILQAVFVNLHCSKIPTLGFRAVKLLAAALKYFTMNNGALCVTIGLAPMMQPLFALLWVVLVDTKSVHLAAELGQSGWTKLNVLLKM